jgi:hypothetical protein
MEERKMTEWLKRITKSEIRSILAVMSVIGFFVVVILLIMKPVPENNRDVLNVTVGFLGAGLVGGVAGYYFGASKDSEQKKEEGEV